MTWRRLVTSFAKVVFTVWGTLSLVFFLSRLLPSGQEAKGLRTEEVELYGLSDAETVAKVNTEYRRRTGLDLPLFYFGFTSTPLTHLFPVPPSQQDQTWLPQAVRWHSLELVKPFYNEWLNWQGRISQEGKNAIIKALELWAKSEDDSQRRSRANTVAYLLQKESPALSQQLLPSWRRLQTGTGELRHALPFFVWNGIHNAYHLWLAGLLKGNLGRSTQDYQPVGAKISASILITVALGLLGLAIGIAFAYGAGLYLALHPFTVFSKVAHFLLYLLDSIPSFLIALALLGLSYMWSNPDNTWQPTTELPGWSLLQLWSHPSVLLGALCTSLFIIPHLLLQFYRSVQTQTSQLYFRTAVAKGLSYRQALQRHALPNALVPSITLLSEIIIGLMSGILVVEVTFSLPGIGNLLTRSIVAGDYPVVIGLTLFFLLFRMLVIWFSETTLYLLDPRRRNE